MERIKRILFGIFFVCLLFCNASFSEELTPQQLTTPANVEFSNCTKTYNMPVDKLYLLSIDSISANRFEIKELQSKMGYVLFKAAGREFLATSAYYGPNKSILRITPANNNYYFAPGIVLNIFKYIDLNLDAEEKPVQKI